jgi:penicillin-binding protein 1C
MAPRAQNLVRLFRSWISPAARLVVSKRGRRVTALVFLSPLLLLLLLAALTPLPDELRKDHSFDASVRVLDRHDKLLAEVRAEDGTRARWVPLDQIGQDMQLALLAAEDSRFRWHPGVDPIAIVRAAGQNLAHARIVSGASTLTQQLGRTLVPRPRTFLGKFKEMAVALRIEASLSKDEILEGYLNLVHFGPTLRGVESASRFYFDKPTTSLSLAEAATLAAMPKGPTLYDPRRAPERLRNRRDHILDRLAEEDWASQERVDRAKREPLTVHALPTGWGAPHLVRGLLDGTVQPSLGKLAGRASVLQTTLDGALQREVQFAARTMVASLRARNVSAASVVVLENDTGEVLSWVGAHDFFDREGGGQNDGVLASRQPGSTLKPFVYALAMEDLGWTAATALPDVELHLPGANGNYSPVNYDGQRHGPVRLREALANSYNVPAVYAASVVGPDRVLGRLRALGLSTLDKDADHYGAAIALGDGEVRLIDLANAYATLARGGESLPVRALMSAKDGRGVDIALPPPTRERVMPASVCRVLADVLSDPNARLASFGEDSVLELPFAVAAKTGTSKGFRDNLTVGFTPRVTVAVWVGNFDGSPMKGVSGVTGAGPLFNAVMRTVHRHFGGKLAEFDAPDERFERVEVCSLSGELPEDGCPNRYKELFIRGTAPQRPCTMHTRVEVDKRNGLLAGPGCTDDHKRLEVFETFDAKYNAWAKASGRPLVPSEWSPLCPGTGETTSPSGKLAIRYPYPGAVFLDDPSMPDTMQGVVLRADAPTSVNAVALVVDGRTVATVGPPFETVLRLSRGKHEVWAEAGSMKSRPVSFEVR